MRAFVVVDITINDPETYERYKTMAPSSIAKCEGKYLARDDADAPGGGPASDPAKD